MWDKNIAQKLYINYIYIYPSSKAAKKSKMKNGFSVVINAGPLQVALYLFAGITILTTAWNSSIESVYHPSTAFIVVPD